MRSFLVPVRMLHAQLWLFSLAIFLSAITLCASQRVLEIEDNSIKSTVFLSPPFYLKPGSVANKFYFDVPFPRGHFALKSFDAEVVDEKGIPVPLHETYLHHWLVEPYYGKKGIQDPSEGNFTVFKRSNYIFLRNSGICKKTLGQYVGLGSETRKTATWVPDPYGIEVGNPNELPQGYEERWLLNVHAIDTRGVEDRLGCTECRCGLYNVSEDERGRALRNDYIGGLACCHDETQCRVRRGFEGVNRKLYLRYTVKWVDWNEIMVPVKIYIFDVTDTGDQRNDTISSCKVEYEVKACPLKSGSNGDCIDTKKARVVIPRGGDVVYGVAHQHSGGIGSALYGQDGRILCTSLPTYGEGKEPGNESGYIVGMSTCYPSPGSVRVVDGEVLTLVSNYSSSQMHTGVMGLFYILVAEPQQQPNTWMFYSFPSSDSKRDEAA